MALAGLIEFDYICVLDFEATCDTKEQMNRGDMEIIEFPSILLDCKTLEVVDEFQKFVTTQKFPVSQYCTDLTGITQAKIEECGLPFVEVLTQHQEWLQSHGIPDTKSVMFVTCGDWDLKTMLPLACKQYSVEVPMIYRSWINIKTPYSYRMSASPAGMAKMLKVLRLKLNGRHHSGIDDCKNITQIVVSLVKKKTPMKATGRLNATTNHNFQYENLSEEAGYGPPPQRGRGRGRGR